MRLTTVVRLTGTLVAWFAPALLAPVAVAAWYGEWADVPGFLLAFAVAGAGGLAISRAIELSAPDLERVRRTEGLAVVAVTWLVVAHVAGIPYLWSGLAPVDALFEAMSGLTATGATILTDFTAPGRGLFFWRALTQWLGGLGIIALFVAVLPRLAIGGRELFFAEAAGPTDEKLMPQLRQSAIALWRLYIALSAAQVAALMLAGLPVFDAVCHALTTMAAGGFSPDAASIAGYDSVAVDWIVTGFMFAAGANFALQYRAAQGSRVAIMQDEEFRTYVGVIVVAVVVLAAFLWRDGFSVHDAVRHGAFQAISIMTSTGYASTDFNAWSDQARIVLFVLMFIGGCAGSAAGGPKVVRHLLMARITWRELRRALHPRGVLPVKLGGRVVPEDTLRDVQAFMLLFLLLFAIGSVVLVALGADLVTGITASIATLGNIGPGFGAIGPMASYAEFHPLAKIVLTLQMWIGRLEVITVLVFVRLEPWRTIRWRD